MSTKVVIIADPGIDTAFATALALHDPNIDVLGILASAGNIPAERATQNVQLLVNAFDPPRWPKIGAAIPIEYEIDGAQLHGPDGLGGMQLPPISLHQPTPADKVLVDLVRDHPHEITLLLLGPGTIFARAMDRDPELPKLLDRIICLGGSFREPGNATAVAEFHFYLDPSAARRTLRCGIPTSLITLDVMRKLIFSPSDLLELDKHNSETCRFLRKIVPYGIRSSSNLYGIEGFHLKDVLGIALIVLPSAFEIQEVYVDVEEKGELTRGLSVFDLRPNAPAPNVSWITQIDVAAIRQYIQQMFEQMP